MAAVEQSGEILAASSPVEILAASSPVEILAASSPVRRSKSIGNGKHCHQCRQNREVVAQCKNQKNSINRPCSVRICNKCLWNRYREKAEEVSTLEEWNCPKCRGICNCSVCMKKRGNQPTGVLSSAVKATAFSSVSEMLEKSADWSKNEQVCADMSARLEKEAADLESNSKEKENSFDGKQDGNFKNLEEKPKKIKRAKLVDGKKAKKPEIDGLNENGDGLPHQDSEILLPAGTELASVADIEMPAEEIGNALQFLQFCTVFAEILDLKKGEAEYILEDVLRGQPIRHEKSSTTLQFHMRLLSIIQTDDGEKRLTRLWFNTLKKCLSDSKYISKEPVMVSLEKAEDYDALSAAEKLRVLNLLCDEALETEKIRTWMNQQESQSRQKAKEAKQELRNAKMKGTIVACSNSEPAQAHEQSVELKDVLLKSHRGCDAVRIKPIFVGHTGSVYWELNCNGKFDVLHQNVGKGDLLTPDDKWSSLNSEEKETVENHIRSFRRK